VGWMMVDGDTSVNIMPLTTFQRLGQQDDELKQMNMSLTGFLGEPPEARGYCFLGIDNWKQDCHDGLFHRRC
jgi:hypothetical protein